MIKTTPEWEKHLPVHVIAGHLNTEVKCLTYRAIPTSEHPTMLTRVGETLDELNAFSLEKGRDRFNIRNIVLSMGGVLLDTSMPTDNEPGETAAAMVTKHPGQLTEQANGLSGAFLSLSDVHRFPLRHVIGELRTDIDGVSVGSIETRILVLKSLVAMYCESRLGQVVKRDLCEQVATEGGASVASIRRHIKRLTNVGLLTDVDTRRRITTFAPTLSCGTQPDALIADTVDVIEAVVSHDESAQELAKSRGDAIMRRTHCVPILVRRSFESSTHTGKQTQHG